MSCYNGVLNCFQVNILLECKLSDKSSSHHSVALKSDLNRKFIRCSSLATVTHLKKFIAKKLLNSSDHYKDIEFLCNEETMFKDHTIDILLLDRARLKIHAMTYCHGVSCVETQKTRENSNYAIKMTKF